MWLEIFKAVAPFLMSLLGAGGTFQFMITRWDEKHKADKEAASVTKDLLCAIAQHNIVEMCDKAIQNGAVTAEEKAIIEDMFAPYEAAGWNNRAHIKVEMMRELPVED